MGYCMCMDGGGSSDRRTETSESEANEPITGFLLGIFFLDVARKYDVRGYPTFIMMKNGDSVEKVIGANKEELKRAIEKHKA